MEEEETKKEETEEVKPIVLTKILELIDGLVIEEYQYDE